MPRVEFTRHLHRYFPALAEASAVEIDAPDVAALLRGLDERYPGLRTYVVDDAGSLRQHVNIFVDRRPILDRRALSDRLNTDSIVVIMQALSGG